MVYHYRHRKKRKINKRVIIAIIPLFVLAGLVYLLFCSPVFDIKKTEISGNKEIKSEEIQNILSCANIFLFSGKKIKNELLERIPKIAELEIEKNIFKRELKIKLSEREEIGIACQANPAFAEATAGKCFYIDKDGVIFENAPQTSGSLITLINDFSGRNIKLGEKIFDEKFIGLIFEIKEEMLVGMNLKIKSFDSMNFPIQNVKAMTSEGWYAFFNFNNNIKSQLSALKVALKEKIKIRTGLEYVDLRIENRIYYK